MPPGLDFAAYSAGVLPLQLPTFGPASVQPEKRLLLAVLEEAVRSWQRARVHDGPRQRELAAWFASDDTSWPCAFVSICETLGIDTAWARMQLGVRPAVHAGAAQRPAPAYEQDLAKAS